MITESDNESALLLTDYFGTREVENYMKIMDIVILLLV